MPISAYLQSIGFFALAVAALLVSAGTAAIPTYWVYLAIFAAVFVASFLLLDPDLARERMRPGGQKPPMAIADFHRRDVCTLDYRRPRPWPLPLERHGPGWLQWLGLMALAAAYALCLWAMSVNRFFSSVVRIQIGPRPGRHHSGPYAVIRHPGYVAGIVIIVTSGLALDSWFATGFLIVFSLPFLLYRAITEDRVLQANCRAIATTPSGSDGGFVPGVW